MLIEWLAAEHPATTMQDLRCSLVALEIHHPEPLVLSGLLKAIDFSEPSVDVTIRKSAVPGLVAHINTAKGLRTIGGPSPTSF